MLQKLIKFVKENLVAVVGIGAIVLSLLLMLLPGQFAHLYPVGDTTNEIFHLNGYEFFFNTKVVGETTYHPGFLHNQSNLADEAIALPAGIAIFVLMVLAVACLVLNKKSSILLAAATLLLVATSILFFAMEASVQDIYGISWSSEIFGKEKAYGVIQWVSYFDGALLILAAGFVGYKTVLAFKDEIKHPQQPKKNDYSYLK